MDTVEPRVSVTEAAYRRLRVDLVEGRLAAGHRLKIGALCRSLSINLSAMREALSRLAADGLVTFEPRRGYRAAPASAAELRDLAQTRTQIEGLCLERALCAGDVAWEAEVLAAFHRLHRVPKPLPDSGQRRADAWFAAHESFHEALVAACDSPWLLRLRRQLYTHSERYQRLSIRPSRDRDVDAEHRALMEAAVARDTDHALALMAAHIELTTRYLLDHAEALRPRV